MLPRLGIVHLQLLNLLKLESADPGLFLLRGVLVVNILDRPSLVFYMTSDFDLR
jgi:hypothetical protein